MLSGASEYSSPLWVSHNRAPFQQAQFPLQTPEKVSSREGGGEERAGGEGTGGGRRRRREEEEEEEGGGGGGREGGSLSAWDRECSNTSP